MKTFPVLKMFCRISCEILHGLFLNFGNIKNIIIFNFYCKGYFGMNCILNKQRNIYGHPTSWRSLRTIAHLKMMLIYKF